MLFRSSQEVANHLATISSDARAEGRLDAADTAITRALEIVAARPECNPVIQDRVEMEAAKVRVAERRFADAESLAQVTYRRRMHGDNQVYKAESAMALGDVYAGESRFADAERMLHAAYATDSAALSPQHQYTLEAMTHLVSLYVAWHHTNDARRYIDRMPDALHKEWARRIDDAP